MPVPPTAYDFDNIASALALLALVSTDVRISSAILAASFAEVADEALLLALAFAAFA